MITALCVCVDYADLLARSLDRWRGGCDRLCIVTSPADLATQELCAAHGVATHVTDVFYAHGADFNKGAALSEAAIVMDARGPGADWICVFDADIVPPIDWRPQLEQYDLRPGSLYGARRWQAPEDSDSLDVDFSRPPMGQGWVLGFFTLFHARDPALNDPLFEIDIPHAGNYDTIFTRQWPRRLQTILPLRMIHLGEERRNWCGRHEQHKLEQIFARRRGGVHGYRENWVNERMLVKPRLAAAAATAGGVDRFGTGRK